MSKSEHGPPTTIQVWLRHEAKLWAEPSSPIAAPGLIAAADRIDHLERMTSFRKARIDALEGALRGMLEALAMGPLEIAAKYGPDAHPDEPLVDAAHKAKAVLET